MTENQNPSPSESWAGSAGNWKARDVHRAELWSGMRILFRFPTLGELATLGQLPERLLKLVLLEYGDPGAAFRLAAGEAAVALDENAPAERRESALAAAEQLGHDLAAMNRELCAAALVEPKLTAEQLGEVPMQDLEMLAGFITRTVAYDAAGRRIGVEPLDTFDRFRDQHGCAADCAACEATRRDFSSVHAGGV